MNGKGKMVLKDGTLYVGEYLDDKKHGQGKLSWRIILLSISQLIQDLMKEDGNKASRVEWDYIQIVGESREEESG